MRLDSTLGIAMEMPFLQANYGLEKELAYILQLIFMVLTSVYILIIDLIIIFFGLQIMAALNILKAYIELVNVKIKSAPNYLKCIIKRHCDVIQNIHWLNNAIKELSFVQFLCSTFILLLMFLFVRKEQSQFSAYFLCVCGLTQILALCLFGEFIKIKADNLSTTLYLINWYEMSLKDQRTFLIILGMAQKKYRLKAAGMYSVSIYSFVQIVKISVTYCAILYTLSK
ncbi:odorant receptor 4-like [Phlebotomus argentipes]|uniref:odorant receptor 4-like n=1 Tax=Phlebotomus argentipes TaxID=94469 RepID=UPI0028929CBB|nr:odorant receptor 4-like [Phlebotomus argentipes]